MTGARNIAASVRARVCPGWEESAAMGAFLRKNGLPQASLDEAVGAIRAVWLTAMKN